MVVAFTVLYGILASPYLSLFPAGLVELFGAAQFPNVKRALYMASGSATLVCTPIAGLLIRGGILANEAVSYWRLTAFTGSFSLGPGIAVFWLRVDNVAS